MAERLERSFPNKTRWTLPEANLICTTFNEEAKVRQQPGEVNKCPSELRKSFFWKIFPLFLGILVKATSAWLTSFFSALNTAHSFSNTPKIFVRKPDQNRRLGSFSFALQSRLLFTVKRNCSVFIHDLERVNEFNFHPISNLLPPFVT